MRTRHTSHEHGRRRPRWLAVVLFVVLAMIAAACGGNGDGTGSDPTTDATAGTATDEGGQADDGEQVTLDYFTFSAAPDHLEDLDRIVSGFEDENPGVTVEVQTASFEDYFTRLQTQVSGGEAPDTFELNYEHFVTYASAGSLLNLDEAAGEAIDPSVYYDEAFSAFQHDGTQFGLPETFSTVVLFYNRDLFDAAGVDYPDSSWTWEDEMAAAEQLTDAEQGVWGDFQPVTFFEFYKVLEQSGGQFFNDDKTQTAFNSPEGQEAANWLLDKVGTVMPTEADMGGQDDVSMFQSGNLAMWHNGIWQFAGLEDADFEWDIVVEPGQAQNASAFFSNAVVASADTEHPEEAAAWLQYLASSETAVNTRLESDWELPAVSDQSLFEPWLEQTPPENRDAVFESLDSIALPPVIERQERLQDAVSGALEQAKLGQLSVEEALQQAADEVNGLLE